LPNASSKHTGASVNWGQMIFNERGYETFGRLLFLLHTVVGSEGNFTPITVEYGRTLKNPKNENVRNSLLTAICEDWTKRLDFFNRLFRVTR